MKNIVLLLIFVSLILGGFIFAADKSILKEQSKAHLEEEVHSGILTESEASFLHGSLKQFGLGLTIKHIILIGNWEFISGKGFKENLNMDNVVNQGDQVTGRYKITSNYLAGYIFDINRDFYPYLCLGVAESWKSSRLGKGQIPSMAEAIKSGEQGKAN